MDNKFVYLIELFLCLFFHSGFSRLFAHIPGDEVYSSCDNTDLENLCEWKEVVCEAKVCIFRVILAV